MKLAADLRIGNVIKINNEPYVVLKFDFNASGRNASMVKLKLQNLFNKQISENAVKASEKYDEVRLERRKMQYLYSNDDMFTFMDNETYNQIDISRDFLGDALNYLLEQMEVEVVFYDENTPVGVDLPTAVELEIVYSEPGVRGDTSGKVMKKAKMETGFEMMVPLFCETGSKVRVDTRNGQFIERVK